ncbi:MAG: MqnA/MqnD/SBP family protein [Bacteroidota bacterium]
MPVHLGVPDAAYVQPLLYEAVPSFQVLTDIPANLARVFRERIPPFHEAGCAFLSPIDYARHGGDYRVLPGVCVASSTRSGTIELFVKGDVRSIRSVAVDVRYTSEIVLTKIILAEKFSGLPGERHEVQFIPMMAELDAMLGNADAALVVHPHPRPKPVSAFFSLDLVEEWNDLTDLPYVHGIWVGREENEQEAFLSQVRLMATNGVQHLGEIAAQLAQRRKVSPENAHVYLSAFSYTLGTAEEESLTEFIRYAYYHGVLPDAPDLNFFDLTFPSGRSLS